MSASDMRTAIIATTSVVCNISMQFGFEIGFVLSGNSPVTLPYTRDRGALPWQPILGLKIAKNAYKCISTR